MVFVYTAMGVLCAEHANVLKLCYIELLSGDGSFRLFSLVLQTEKDKLMFYVPITMSGQASSGLLRQSNQKQNTFEPF